MNAFLKHCSLACSFALLLTASLALGAPQRGGFDLEDVAGFEDGNHEGSYGQHHQQHQHQQHQHQHQHQRQPKVEKQPHELLGDVWNQMSGSFGELVGGGKKEAPLAAQKHVQGGKLSHQHQQPIHGAQKKPEIVTGSPAPSAVAEIVVKEEEKKDLFGLKKAGDFLKLLLNPLELCKAISAHFKIKLEKFVELVGKGLVFGTEALLTPLVVTLKIIEKVFVPDACRLKFICRAGSHLSLFREKVLKFSPHLLEGSGHIKALTDGIAGRDCDVIFTSCEPKLKKPFDDLKHSKGRSVDESKVISGISSETGTQSSAAVTQPDPQQQQQPQQPRQSPSATTTIPASS